MTVTRKPNVTQLTNNSLYKILEPQTISCIILTHYELKEKYN